MKQDDINSLWNKLRHDAAAIIAREPVLNQFIHDTILNHNTMGSSLAYLLSRHMPSGIDLNDLLQSLYTAHPSLVETAALDLQSVLQNDPAAQDVITPYLYFKGFKALQTYRAAHILWHDNRRDLALFLQSRASFCYGVDIHPAATIGHSITFDHASGIVIGETARVGNHVLMLHNVTLGGKGTETGDRHPIIEDHVKIGAGAKILGRIIVGAGSFVAAGSLVLKPVATNSTVAGVPAKEITKKQQQDASSPITP